MTGILPIKKYGEHSAINIFSEYSMVDPKNLGPYFGFTGEDDMTTFKTRDDVLTLLVHLGYLTYDERDSEVSIPNEEIAQEFVRAVKVSV